MVRRLLGDPRVHARAWEVERVGWAAVNPGTIGIRRVRGVADTREGSQPFCLVFKAVADVEIPGLPSSGYMHEPQDWNYWKREPLAFASGLLSAYRGPLAPVRCVGIEDRGNVAFMWLEELHDEADDGWSLERHVLAAQHLGRFNGDHADEPPSASMHPWLCQHFTRGWLATLTDIGAAAACQSEDVWRHPALRTAFPRPLGGRVADLLADADDLLAVRAGLPLTLTHHDAHRENLVSCLADGADSTRALDWGFLGLAPIGEDLGHQVGVNVFRQHIAAPDAARYEQAATDAYLSGLRQAGVDADVHRLRTYARGVAALQMVSYGAAHVAWLSEETVGESEPEEAPWPTTWAAARGIDADHLMSDWATAFHWLLELGDAARRAAGAL